MFQLAAMTRKIGYPDVAFEEADIEEEYKNVSEFHFIYISGFIVKRNVSWINSVYIKLDVNRTNYDHITKLSWNRTNSDYIAELNLNITISDYKQT